jgi:hypothetical protein
MTSIDEVAREVEAQHWGGNSDNYRSIAKAGIIAGLRMAEREVSLRANVEESLGNAEIAKHLEYAAGAILAMKGGA